MASLEWLGVNRILMLATWLNIQLWEKSGVRRVEIGKEEEEEGDNKEEKKRKKEKGREKRVVCDG